MRDDTGFWTNWGRNLESKPVGIFHPKNLNELQKIIHEAITDGTNVHAVGAGHSWSNLVPTEGYIIRLDNINKLLAVNTEKCQVQVEAGMTLHDLINHLDQHGLALSNLGRVTKQSIAGATATGTHGTGYTPTLAAFIVALELVTTDGQLKRITIEQDPETLAAARLSLGCLGIIYSITLQCEKQYNLEDYCYMTDIQNMTTHYEKLLSANTHFMFEWNPYNGKALAYLWNKTTKTAVKKRFGGILKALKEGLLNAFTIFCRAFPKYIPELIDLRFKYSAHGPHVGVSYSVLTRPYLGMRYVECEMSIKPELLKQAVAVLEQMFREFQSRDIYVPRVTFRFVAEEKGTFLSPTYDGNRVFISLVMPAQAQFQEVFPEYQRRMAQFNARPHWGKVHEMEAELAEKLYGKNLEKFMKIRKELDPKGIFLNESVSEWCR